MNQAEEDALVNEIFDKSWRTEPGAQTSLFNMAESIRLAIRAAVAAERERDEARELSVQGSARLFAAMNFERDEWKRKAEESAGDAARYRHIRRDPSMLLHLRASEFDSAIDAAIAAKGSPADPCPQCVPGGTCSTAECKRKGSSELMRLYGIPSSAAKGEA